MGYIVLIPVDWRASISLIPVEGQVSSEDFLLGKGVASGRFELYPTGFEKRSRNVRALYLLETLQIPATNISIDVVVLGRDCYGLQHEEAQLVKRFIENNGQMALKKKENF